MNDDPSDFRHGWTIFGPLVDKNTWKRELVELPASEKFSRLFYPSALRAGGLLSSRSRRPGGRLLDLRNPYLCNCLMDFRHSKFCGIF